MLFHFVLIPCLDVQVPNKMWRYGCRKIFCLPLSLSPLWVMFVEQSRLFLPLSLPCLGAQGYVLFKMYINVCVPFVFFSCYFILYLNLCMDSQVHDENQGSFYEKKSPPLPFPYCLVQAMTSSIVFGRIFCGAQSGEGFSGFAFVCVCINVCCIYLRFHFKPSVFCDS